MSASLVGSEMCIRDRCSCAQAQGAHAWVGVSIPCVWGRVIAGLGCTGAPQEQGCAQDARRLKCYDRSARRGKFLPLTIRVANLPMWYSDDKHSNKLMRMILGQELWKNVYFTSMPKSFDRKRKYQPYGCQFGSVTFKDNESARRARAHVGVREMWGDVIKAT
eukprot:4580239-Alexandrium_andersonii.AAC.1